MTKPINRPSTDRPAINSQSMNSQAFSSKPSGRRSTPIGGQHKVSGSRPSSPRTSAAKPATSRSHGAAPTWVELLGER